MSNLNLQKLREWVWPWPWTFNHIPAHGHHPTTWQSESDCQNMLALSIHYRWDTWFCCWYRDVNRVLCGQ